MCTDFQRFLMNQRKVLEYAEYFADSKRKSVRWYRNWTTKNVGRDE